MTREDFISDIEALFPVDAPFIETAEVGEKLLMEAITESDWRDLPTDILALYHAKCVREENRTIQNMRGFLRKEAA